MAHMKATDVHLKRSTNAIHEGAAILSSIECTKADHATVHVSTL
jgi:hypothetical protein